MLERPREGQVRGSNLDHATLAFIMSESKSPRALLTSGEIMCVHHAFVFRKVHPGGAVG